MKKLAANFLKLIYIVTVFFCLYIANVLNQYIENDFYINNCKNNHTTSFEVGAGTSIKELQKHAKGKDLVIAKELETSAQVIGIYYGDEIRPNIAVRGRFFQKKDMEEQSRTAVVGQEVLKELKDKSTYVFGQEKYKIIGVIQNSEKGKWGAYKVYLNLTAIPEATPELYSGSYEYTSNTLPYKDYHKEMKEEGLEVSNGKAVVCYSPLRNSLENNKIFLLIFLLLIAICILNIFVSLSFWIEAIRKEIGIRKCLGAENGALVGFLLKKLSKYIGVGLIVGGTFYELYAMIMKISQSISLFIVGSILLSLIVVTSIGILPMIVKIRKIMPVEMMR